MMCLKISLSKRESFVIPPLEEEVDSTASAVEDGGVQKHKQKKNLPDTNIF